MDDIAAAGTGTTLRLRHRFAASPEKVFDAWTRPEALRRWWCPAGWLAGEITVDLRVGGTYRLTMRRESGAQILSVFGTFLEVRPAAKLVYTWMWDGAFPDMPETRVTVEFHPVPDGTELVLQQAKLDLRHCTRHLGGWLGACDRLALGLDVARVKLFPILVMGG